MRFPYTMEECSVHMIHGIRYRTQQSFSRTTSYNAFFSISPQHYSNPLFPDPPSLVYVHSRHSVAVLTAFCSGVSVKDICTAVAWAMPCL